MKLCVEKCFEENKTCNEEKCKNWINYNKDLNCLEIAIKKNGAMTLCQAAERLGISYVRVAQIEKKAIRKLQKKVFK